MERTTSSSLLSSHSPGEERVRAHLPGVPGLQLVRGREAILKAQPVLAELARRCGQSGEPDSLPYFLSTPDAMKKTPYLLLMRDTWSDAIDGAVLIFEYRTWLGGTRVFSTADATGRRTVIAAPECRARMAAVVARMLLERGAQVVHIAFSETHTGPEFWDGAWKEAPAAGLSRTAIASELQRGVRDGTGFEWMLTEQEMPLYLPLYRTFDRTLARIGQRTRSNLRYYRRRSELDLGCRFVAEVEISREDFLAFNRECTYAVTDELAAWRFETLRTLPNTMLRGVADRSGRWLSLVGMRGNGRFVEIDWQMNRADLPLYSLSTVMRSYLIEHEIGRGTTRLYIEGGTPQPIGRSFLKERVAELTLKRRSAYVWLLARFAGRVVPAKNRLARILADPDARWVRR